MATLLIAVVFGEFVANLITIIDFFTNFYTTFLDLFRFHSSLASPVSWLTAADLIRYGRCEILSFSLFYLSVGGRYLWTLITGLFTAHFHSVTGGLGHAWEIDSTINCHPSCMSSFTPTVLKFEAHCWRQQKGGERGHRRDSDSRWCVTRDCGEYSRH